MPTPFIRTFAPPSPQISGDNITALNSNKKDCSRLGTTVSLTGNVDFWVTIVTCLYFLTSTWAAIPPKQARSGDRQARWTKHGRKACIYRHSLHMECSKALPDLASCATQDHFRYINTLRRLGTYWVISWGTQHIHASNLVGVASAPRNGRSVPSRCLFTPTKFSMEASALVGKLT